MLLLTVVFVQPQNHWYEKVPDPPVLAAAVIGWVNVPPSQISPFGLLIDPGTKTTA
jgi:hypothetical protein